MPGKRKLHPPGDSSKPAKKAGDANARAKKKAAAKKGPKKKKKTKKEDLKCGENGKYGKLLNKSAAKKFERDHIPSAGALRTKAMNMMKAGSPGKAPTPLCKKQKAAIGRAADACAIPKGLHALYSQTFRNLNTTTMMQTDAGDLKAAANRNTEAIRNGMDDPKMKVSPACKKKYDDWAKKVNDRPNSWYEDLIKKALKSKNL